MKYRFAGVRFDIQPSQTDVPVQCRYLHQKLPLNMGAYLAKHVANAPPKLKLLPLSRPFNQMTKPVKDVC
jgi:hypothetical protein